MLPCVLCVHTSDEKAMCTFWRKTLSHTSRVHLLEKHNSLMFYSVGLREKKSNFKPKSTWRSSYKYNFSHLQLFIQNKTAKGLFGSRIRRGRERMRGILTGGRGDILIKKVFGSQEEGKGGEGEGF